MKILPITLLVAFTLSGAVNAATYASYTTDFTSFGTVNSNIAGKDGWTINDTTSQFSFVANWNGSKSLGLGDASAVAVPPTVASVALTHGYDSTIGRTTLSMKLAVFDSVSDDPAFTNRDIFGFSIGGSSGKLFSLFMVPSNATPTDPSSELNGQWNLYYSLGAGPTIALPLAILEASNYTMNLSFKTNLSDSSKTDFKLDVVGSNLGSSTVTGLSMNPLAVTTDLNVLWNQVGSNDYGSNVLMVDNLSIVPEASSSILTGLAAVGLLCRRKRP